MSGIHPPPVRHRVLIIDDEPVIGLSCERILLPEKKYRLNIQTDPVTGLKEALTGHYDLILLDLVMPELEGMEILKRIKGAGIPSEVIIITGHATIKTAVESMQLGAADYISKPFSPDELKIVLEKVIQHSAVLKENIALRKELHLHRGFEGIIGKSIKMERIFSLIKRVAPTDGSVLITGESGTGKELIAAAIHRTSRRQDRPFITCDCSTLVPSLLESELFGHVKGSFTGSIATKKGVFEIADRGTLFLDEVSNISLEIQTKLLRVLETSRVRKVGSTTECQVDIRLITATNQDLGQMVQKGNFREDLYYRLKVVPINLPPLRERTEDILELAVHFLEKFKKKNPTPVRGFHPDTIIAMEKYDWPGNVRELRNLVERLAILTDSEIIAPGDLPSEFFSPSLPTVTSELPHSWEEFKNFKQEVQNQATREIEKEFLVQTLTEFKGNITRAATAIGIQRTHLHQLLKKYSLNAKDYL